MVERSSPGYRRFLARLSEARHAAELTQAEVARKLKKPQSYVSKCETGERRVDVIELAEFAALYDKPLAWLVPTRSR